MIRITAADFEKFLKYLKKEGMDGAILNFREEGTWLHITTVDRSGKEMRIEICDQNYAMMPRITKTETI